MKSRRLSLLLSLLVGCAFPQCVFSQEDVSRIAGLLAWYRADHVTQGSNNVLTALNDCSKNVRHIVAGAKPPTVVAQAINGQPVLRFSGDETPLVADGNNWSAAGFTAFVVASYAVIPEQPRFRGNPGYAFDKWVIHGDAAVDNPSNPSATITVPTSDVTITATYRLK